jgi:orotidine-5'-phosphate decarboxylase
LASFGENLQTSFRSFGNLCVGIDPHPKLLADWNLANSPAGIRSFANIMLDSIEYQANIIKPQVAFFEQFGSAGFKILEEICERAKASGILVIADAKRGDIGSTMTAYARAWLGRESVFAVDALTVSPYLGFGALVETVEVCRDNEKGLFVLVATSNPEATSIQKIETLTGTIASDVFNSIIEANTGSFPTESLGSIGAVLGATVSLGDYEIDPMQSNAVPILAPGFGYQGAALEDAKAIYGRLATQVVYNVSRSLIGPDPKLVIGNIQKASLALARGLRDSDD